VNAVRPTSLTHQHLLAVVNTECRRFDPGTVRILDFGCGDGRLLGYLAARLPELNPAYRYELHGLDVCTPGVQREGFLDGAKKRLADTHPSVDWDDRLQAIEVGASWPYANGYFHAIVSNQVLEHVNNHDFVFGEIARTLAVGSWSAHLFPLKHYVHEGHLKLPLVHRILNRDLQRAYIRTLSRAGLGKFREHRAATGITLDHFADRHTDYMQRFTNYLTSREALRIAARQGLSASFRYTGEFYRAKLRTLTGRQPLDRYDRERSSLVDWAAAATMRYVSSVTLFLENRPVYRAPAGASGASVHR
jgi:SAM-dependent methyltransferase